MPWNSSVEPLIVIQGSTWGICPYNSKVFSFWALWLQLQKVVGGPILLSTITESAVFYDASTQSIYRSLR